MNRTRPALQAPLARDTVDFVDTVGPLTPNGVHSVHTVTAAGSEKKAAPCRLPGPRPRPWSAWRGGFRWHRTCRAYEKGSMVRAHIPTAGSDRVVERATANSIRQDSLASIQGIGAETLRVH